MTIEEQLTRLAGGEWRQVKSHPRYYVSSEGKVASLINGNLKPLKGGKNGKYRTIHIAGVGPLYIHRLVCEAWHGPCPDGKETAHKNGKHDDNRQDNLEWKTKRENHADILKHGSKSNAVLNLEQAERIRSFRAQGASLNELSRMFRVGTNQISLVIRGKVWTNN